MPELAEIKIMADYINTVCKNEDFTIIGVSPEVSGRLSLVQPTDLQIFNISAESRGKELLLTLTSGDLNHSLSVSMGMSGYWFLSKSRWDIPKHTHLKFNSVSGRCLCLVDVRRFAKWKWANSWSSNRGPCPVKEFDLFKKNIQDNLLRKEFNTPIHLVLMNQQYFNGIGNYLRAEILFKANQNPFISARQAIIDNPIILELCSQLPKEAYILGGGQLKDWENPFDFQKVSFSEWLTCYSKPNALSIVDNIGRKLWYHKSQVTNEI